jgi:DNA polymerase V
MVAILTEWIWDEPLRLPYIEASVPAGFPSPADDYLEMPLDLNDFLVGQNKAAIFLMRVAGDSMKEEGILDGDLLVVDRSAQPATGSIVVVAVNGEFTVKRLRRTSDGVWLEAANPRFRSIHVTAEDELHIFGVVRHAIHSLR